MTGALAGAVGVTVRTDQNHACLGRQDEISVACAARVELGRLRQDDANQIVATYPLLRFPHEGYQQADVVADTSEAATLSVRRQQGKRRHVIGLSRTFVDRHGAFVRPVDPGFPQKPGEDRLVDLCREILRLTDSLSDALAQGRVLGDEIAE